MSTATIRTISPSTNEVVCQVPSTSAPEAKAMAISSAEAFLSWRNVPLAERRAIVERGLALIQERRMELGRELTEQMGRPIAYSHKEIETMQKRADYLLETAEEALANIPGHIKEGWLQALAQESPRRACPGLLCLEFQSGDPQLLREVIQMSEIKAVSFTGSTAAGSAVRHAAAGRTTPVPLNLELGGTDPAYVRPDADLKYTAAQLVDGAAFNAGQSCCAIERIYVHADVHDALVEELQEELKRYRLGDPFEMSTNIGPVVSRASQDAINAHIEDALAQGAVDATPANNTFSNPYAAAGGNYVAPRLLINVNHKMMVMQEETFGPVIPVAKVSGDDEAVALMNDSGYGLTASVWTRDIARGGEVIEELEAGTVFLNRCDYPSPDLAWTGWKNSGLGCTLGPRAFDFFVKLKSYHVKEAQA
ncbi:hypothetical protein ACJ41O_009217 [Fusarium nematophilum]